MLRFCVIIILHIILTCSASAQTGFQYILGENVHIRSGPSLSFQILSKLSKGSQVKIFQKKGEWYKVSSGTTTGWVFREFVGPSKVLELRNISDQLQKQLNSLFRDWTYYEKSGWMLHIERRGSQKMCGCYEEARTVVSNIKRLQNDVRSAFDGRLPSWCKLPRYAYNKLSQMEQLCR